jgi:hypothetical protein
MRFVEEFSFAEEFITCQEVIQQEHQGFFEDTTVKITF